MEQHFFEDEFEQFLRENADQHRMYPTEGVWTNIYRKFHPGKRRIMIAILLLMVLSGLFWLSNNAVLPGTTNKTALPNTTEDIEFHDHFSTVTVDDIIEKLRAKSLMPPLELEAPAALKPLQITRELRPSLVNLPLYFSASLNYAEQFSMAHWDLVLPRLVLPVYKLSELPFNPAVAVQENNPSEEKQALSSFSDNESASFTASIPIISVLPSLNFVQKMPVEVKEQSGYAKPSQESNRLFIDSAMLATYSTTRILPIRKNKLELAIHFVPTMGYRNLFDSKNWVTYGNSPLMVSRLNVNQFVDHKPAMGFELGGALRYRLNRSFIIKTGLQLNLARYSIGAFAHSLEKTAVALNSSFGFRPDTLMTTSNLRNLAGNRPERLNNQYLQVSVPIGAELKIFGDDRLQVNIGGSLQPGYLLNTNQVQLSADFSNYVSEPSLLRRWNLASSMEVFVTYRSGSVNWQIGPQFRYNLLSTFKKAYPIKENLMEYGLKIGITRPLR